MVCFYCHEFPSCLVRLHNKSYYLQLGLQKMMSKDELQELRRHITLTVDGNRVTLPDIAGLIVLNIQSWGAGADPWGSTNDPVGVACPNGYV